MGTWAGWRYPSREQRAVGADGGRACHAYAEYGACLHEPEKKLPFIHTHGNSYRTENDYFHRGFQGSCRTFSAGRCRLTLKRQQSGRIALHGYK